MVYASDFTRARETAEEAQAALRSLAGLPTTPVSKVFQHGCPRFHSCARVLCWPATAVKRLFGRMRAPRVDVPSFGFFLQAGSPAVGQLPALRERWFGDLDAKDVATYNDVGLRAPWLRRWFLGALALNELFLSRACKLLKRTKQRVRAPTCETLFAHGGAASLGWGYMFF